MIDKYCFRELVYENEKYLKPFSSLNTNKIDFLRSNFSKSESKLVLDLKSIENACCPIYYEVKIFGDGSFYYFTWIDGIDDIFELYPNDSIMEFEESDLYQMKAILSNPIKVDSYFNNGILKKQKVTYTEAMDSQSSYRRSFFSGIHIPILQRFITYERRSVVFLPWIEDNVDSVLNV